MPPGGRWIAVLAALLAASFARADLAREVADALAPAHVEGEFLVGFQASLTASDRAILTSQLGGTRLHRFRSGAERWKLPAGADLANALMELRQRAGVRFAEPNYRVELHWVPKDPRFPELWGLHNTGQAGGTGGADVDAPRAWEVTLGSPDVVVAVIDSGLDTRHPDLAANVWTNPGETPGNGLDDDGNGFVDDVHGWDFVYGDDEPEDQYGHGTHVAGTIAAVGNNHQGVIGVAPGVRLVALRMFDETGHGDVAGGAAAIEYGTAIGVDVMNASWGDSPYSQTLRDAIAQASGAGVLFVAAAGNSFANTDLTPIYPACYDLPNIIAVTALDHDDAFTFGNWGPETVDLGAPGVDILSTFPGGGYELGGGTSMAAPHVSGVAALVRSMAPAIAVPDWRARLLAAVDPVPALTFRTVTGGRINAYLAVADLARPRSRSRAGRAPRSPAPPPSPGFRSKMPTGDRIDPGEADGDGRPPEP